MPPRTQEEPQIVNIRPLDIKVVEVEIEGVTPLITNPWHEKAKELLRQGQGIGVEPNAPKKKKDPKNPEAEYEARLAEYRLPNGDNGFPAVAFKGAMVEAARSVAGLTMVAARTLFFLSGTHDEHLVTIQGEPKMLESFPRNDSGVVDIRYRPIFHDWWAVLQIKFDQERIPLDSVFNLVNRAGYECGVGEWRPLSKKSNTGQYGQFRVRESTPKKAARKKR
jgi:hypothetical protein